MPRFQRRGGPTTKRKVPRRVTAWSFSRYQLWRMCPARFAYKTFDRLDEPKGPAMLRGIEIHGKAEGYLKGAITRVPADLKLVADDLKRFKKLKAQAEGSRNVDINWKPLDDPFHPAVWLRMKLDVRVDTPKANIVADWKTGKPNPAKDQDQMDLYAATELQPGDDRELQVELIYTDRPEDSVVGVYEPDEVAGLRADWVRRVKPMLMDKRFEPKPGNHCSFCPFSKDKGGPCAY
jgi:hypothetical protein